MANEPESTAGAASLDAAYFERVYAADPDPWRFETSAYEHAKYDRTLAVLPREKFERGVEIGCSIGVLTEQLAVRCASLLALDVSEAALTQARARCAALPRVEFVRMQVPDEVPGGRFDLVLLSEVGYYWSRGDLQRASAWMVGSLRPEGALVLVHWTDPVHDYPLTGDQVHDHVLAIAGQGGLQHRHGERHARYRLDVFTAVASGHGELRAAS